MQNQPSNQCYERFDEAASEIISSSPGKVILHGEHAVVYGKTAVAVSIDLRTTVGIKIGGNDVRLKLNDLNADHIWPFSSFEEFRLIEPVERKMPTQLEFSEDLLKKLKPFIDDMHFDAFYPYGHDGHHETVNLEKEDESKFSITQINNSLKAFLLLYLGISDICCHSKRLPLEIVVTSSLPCGAGLGSSSAFTVSLTSALFRAFNVKASRQQISDWAFQIDKLFHGKPSGIDNSICTFGGALLFRSGKIEKQISKLPDMEVILVNTKIPRNTKMMVQVAKENFDKFPDVFDHVLCAIDAVSKSAWNFFDGGKSTTNGSTLKDLFYVNQLLLESFKVSHPSIDKIVNIAAKFDFAAKLTGAGGGGTVIIFVENSASQESIKNLVNELEENQFEFWKVAVGCDGVTVDDRLS